MAIAFGGISSQGTTQTVTSVAVSGSDTIGVVYVMGDVGADNISAVTWDGVSMTKIGAVQCPTDRFLSAWWIINPTSAASIVFTGASLWHSFSSYYTGALQTGQPFSSNTGSNTSSLAITVATTVVASDCWTVMVQKDNQGSQTYTTDVGVMRVANNGSGYAISDSNGTVGTGSQSTTLTAGGSHNHGAIAFSIAPATYTGLLTNLVSYWKLDEASGARLDSHANNDLADNNTVGSATGILNLGADFESGNSEYLTAVPAAINVDDTWSISLWIKRESTGATNYFMYQRSGENGSAFGIDSSDKVFMVSGSGSFGGSAVSTASLTSTAAFYHVVVIFNGAASKIYINGSLDSTVTCNAITPPNTELNIGTNHTHDAGFLDGILDEVGIWSRALTAPEVTSLYNAGAGLAYPLTVGTPYTMVAALGTFSFTGIAALFHIGRVMLAALGTFALTGIAATFQTGKGMVAGVGSFILTGINANFSTTAPAGWSNLIKHNATFTNQSKNTSIWTNETKT